VLAGRRLYVVFARGAGEGAALAERFASSLELASTSVRRLTAKGPLEEASIAACRSRRGTGAVRRSAVRTTGSSRLEALARPAKQPSRSWSNRMRLVAELCESAPQPVPLHRWSDRFPDHVDP